MSNLNPKENQMNINVIKQKIKKAIADEKKTNRLANSIRDLSLKNGGTLTDKDVSGVVAFVREYIEHVPIFMEEGASNASQLGLDPQMHQMLGELEAYWVEENDLIPDHLGLVGLADDAYASLTLLQSISDYCKATCGHPLMQADFTQANQQIRLIIGESVATALDQRVAITVANAMVGQLINQFANSGFMFGSSPDPIWGNASPSEIANARLGAMGIF